MATPAHPTSPNRPLFLYIPISRLILLSIVSFGLYEAYWIYKNWRYLKERTHLKIMPFWRGIFGIFFCYGLLRAIHGDAEARAVRAPAFQPDMLAITWIILTLLGRGLDRVGGIHVGFTILSGLLPTYLCLVPVQSYVNEVAKARNPQATYYKFSTGHIVCLVFGILVWLSISVIVS